ncbi:MAG: hypothetical protein BGO77_01690 [Caedibacter sp. 37-49]|nr:MAG: hypothetical protein BGO77_01690 [Caedibacter sp. 37-49]
MKKCLLIIALLFPLFSPRVGADDYQLIRNYIVAEVQMGKTQSYFARTLKVSDATISLFVNNKVTSSPKLLRNFKSRLPAVYKELTTPKKASKKKKVVAKIAIAKRLDFEAETVKSEEEAPVEIVKEKLENNSHNVQNAIKNLLNKPSQIKVDRKKITSAKPAPIVIAFRDEGSGKGAFYDHYTVQKATKYPTLISAHPKMRLKSLKDHSKTITYRLKHGVEQEGQVIPESIDNFSDQGLLFIPGRIRDNEFEPVRKEHEENILKQARLRGQPILAVCAGSWRLWEALGGKLEEVSDHSYGGGMIRLNEMGKIGYNKQIHRIKVESNTLLNDIMNISKETDRPSVNSVHWKAPSEKKIPSLVRVSAKAVADNKIAPNTRQGTQMKPQNDTIEAFENQYGAPLLGIQWHPEAYTKNDSDEMTPDKHIAILEFMAKAGQAYHHKRLMLKELEEVTQKH